MEIAQRGSYEILSTGWRELCESYLPVVIDDQWRYSRRSQPGDPDQGWKLHVSATILTANETLKRIGPELKKRGALYKATFSLSELAKLNAGIFYGYSQIGKFITVYPREGEEIVSLANTLHRLTRGLAAPLIPFDTQLRPGSNIYYRYGAFTACEIESDNGKPVSAIRDANGNLVPDVRNGDGPPLWVTDPFPLFQAGNKASENGPLGTRYKVFRALSQRGKGGVFNAIDMGVDPPRLCTIKEGRRNGEVDWDGLDGYDYVKREARNLEALASAGPDIPMVYSSFEAEGNFYLVTEYIYGETLHDVLMKRQRRLSLKSALELSGEIARLMELIHAAGWAWHDCKPSNLIVTRNGKLRPVDFEGARAFADPKSLIWGTSEFLPPEWKEKVAGESIIASDLYALGVMIYCLLSGRYYDKAQPVPLEKLRRDFPRSTRDIIRELLSPDPKKRPDTGSVIRGLRADMDVLSSLRKPCPGRSRQDLA